MSGKGHQEVSSLVISDIFGETDPNRKKSGPVRFQTHRLILYTNVQRPRSGLPKSWGPLAVPDQDHEMSLLF